jgi:3-mercaptopyruvate sulfurtransferase SseA
MSSTDFPVRKYLIDARELGERLETVTLIDLRPAEDFAVGPIEGSSHLDLYGVSLNDSSDAPLKAFLSMLQTLFGTRGVSPDKTVIPVCHGGYRSANTFLALKSLGYPRVRNYVGSWGEWGNRDDSRIVVPGP